MAGEDDGLSFGKDETQPSIGTPFDWVVLHLAAFERIFGFIPLFVVVVDFFLREFFETWIVPYRFIDTRYFLYLVLVLILISAIFLVEMRSRVLGKHGETSVELAWGRVAIPKFSTTDLIKSRYFQSRKEGKNVKAVIVYVVIDLIAIMLFGIIVSLLIYKNYLWRP